MIVGVYISTFAGSRKVNIIPITIIINIMQDAVYDITCREFFKVLADHARYEGLQPRHPIAGLRQSRNGWSVSDNLHPLIEEHVLTSNTRDEMVGSRRAYWIVRNIRLFQSPAGPATWPTVWPAVCVDP